MENLTLLVQADSSERESLKRLINKAIATEFLECATDQEALEKAAAAKRKIDFAFSPWEVSEERRRFVQELKNVPNARETYHLHVASADDAEWIRPTLRALDAFAETWGDTSRVANFLHQVQLFINPPTAGRASVLLVDDDPEVRQILRDYLSRFGFAQLSEAGTGREALALLEQNPGTFSLVLSDWRMPEMTGLELLKRVRLNPELSRVAFIMVTSKTPIEQIKTIQAADFGVNGYILKPFTMKSFQSQLDAVLNDISKHRAAEAFLVAGRTLLALGNHFGAETVFKEAMVPFPDHPLMLEGIGDAYSARGQDSKALTSAAEVYEKALQKSPYNPGLFIKCFEVYTALGRMNDAVRLLKSHKPRASSDDAFRTRLGKIYLQNGYPELAQIEFDQAIAANPDNSEAKELARIAEKQATPDAVKKAG